MSYIKKLRILGFKKFNDFTIDFNENISILIGANEVGKSTILEAIDIVLNQRCRFSEKSIIWDMLNIDNIKNFKHVPTVYNLPSIEIYLDIEFDKDDFESCYYFGTNNYENEKKKGIYFKCEFNKEDYEELLREEIEKGEIPIEYYIFKWKTYGNQTYIFNKKPFKSLLINTDKIDSTSSFNYYNRSLFRNKYTDLEIMAAKNSFDKRINNIFEELNLEEIGENQKFKINKSKVLLESLISIYDNEVILENKGCGRANLIKTNIAIDKAKNNINVVLIEEPENHLSYENLLMMIDGLKSNDKVGQIIITTHNDLIASRLGLQNIIWLSKNKSIKLQNIDSNTAKFFIKMDNNNLLQFLMAEKVILVEGVTEYLLFPHIYKSITNSTLESDKISIISCRGVSFKRYLRISQSMGKKTVVITDNDSSEDKIKFMLDFNTGKVDNSYYDTNIIEDEDNITNDINRSNNRILSNDNLKIFMDKDVNNWTWEVCIYNLNEDYFKNKITIKSNTKYKYNKVSYIDKPYLGKMLNNKAETAYNMLEWGIGECIIPEYVKEAIKCIIE